MPRFMVVSTVNMLLKNDEWHTKRTRGLHAIVIVLLVTHSAKYLTINSNPKHLLQT